MYPTYTPLETNRLLSKEELINNVLVKYNGQVDKRRVEKALLMEEVISNRLGSYVCCRIDELEEKDCKIVDFENGLTAELIYENTKSLTIGENSLSEMI